jgi:1-deoxy-D-xylulose 5-phosphate reductoisomerase
MSKFAIRIPDNEIKNISDLKQKLKIDVNSTISLGIEVLKWIIEKKDDEFEIYAVKSGKSHEYKSEKCPLIYPNELNIKTNNHMTEFEFLEKLKKES